MIYINNETTEISILKAKKSEINKIKFINQTDKTVLTFDLDNVQYKKNCFIIDLTDIISDIKVTGQYNYYLYKDDTLVQSGIMQFNNFNSEITTYNIEQNLIQYG